MEEKEPKEEWMLSNPEVETEDEELSEDENYMMDSVFLCGLLMTDKYAEFRERYKLEMIKDENDKPGLPVYSDWYDYTRYHPVYRHYVAESILEEDVSLDEMKTMGLLSAFPFFSFAELVMNPLCMMAVYEDENGVKQHPLEEKFIKERFCENHAKFGQFFDARVLEFADDPHLQEHDNLRSGLIKGMHVWFPLTGDFLGVLDKILAGERGVYNDLFDMRWYDVASLRKNLVFIADHRGGARALELLRMLQKEWPDIKRWKTGFKSMEAEDIAQFEDVLMHGYDSLIEEWAGQEELPSPTKQNPAAEPVHVVIDNVKDLIPAHQAFEEPVYPRKKDYAAVVEWLEKQKAKGTDFYVGAGYNRTEMCRTLTKIFGWDVSENSLRKAQNPPKK